MQYSGIPGTTSLSTNERLLMFLEERQELEAQDKVVDIFREFLDIIQGTSLVSQQQMSGAGMTGGQKSKPEGGKSKLVKVAPQFGISNDHLIRFKVFEMMQSRSGGSIEINQQLIKRINNMTNQPAYFAMQTSQSQICFYKMLKCESKLIRFILELNGLMSTDRHDWDMLWTHTQGKTYFYERLTPTQKINHFPLSLELTRKDRLAINIKKMQMKYSKTYFNFIPETFVLPD